MTPQVIAASRRTPRAARAGVRRVQWRAPLAVKLALAFIGLVAVVLTVNGAIDTWLMYNQAKRTALAFESEKARSAAERVEVFLAEIQNQLGWTAGAEWGFAKLDDQRYDFIRLLRQTLAITGLAYIDGKGKERLAVSRLEPDSIGSGKDFSQDPRFVRAVADKVWYGPVEFRRGSEPYMTIAVAHAGRNPGVTAADVNLKLIWDVINAIHVGEQGYAYVVDDNGRLIAHPDLSLVLRDSDLSNLPQVRTAIDRLGPAKTNESEPSAPMVGSVEIARGLDGAAVLTAYAIGARSHWIVFVQQPLSEALANAYGALLRSAGLLLFGLALAAVSGVALARRMASPIRQLQQGADEIGAGDLTRRIEIRTGDEIENLAERFNQMAERIKESYDTLEAKVEARTRDLEESLTQQTATAEVLKVISRSVFDLDTVLQTLIDTAVRLTKGSRGTIFIREGDALFARAFHSNVSPELKHYLAGQTWRLDGDSHVARAAREQQVVHIADLTKSDIETDRETSKRAAFGAGIWTPLMRGGEAIGVLGVPREQPVGFSDREIELIRTFADQAVIAIENARLFGEVKAKTRDLEETLAQQTATANALKMISRSSLGLRDVMQTLIDSAVSLCADDGVVYLRKGDVFLAEAAFDADEEKIQLRNRTPRIPGRASTTGRVALSGEVEYIPDTLADPEFELPPDQRLKGIRSLVGVPLLREGRVEGVFILGRREPGRFGARAVELAKTFADQAVIVIENVRLFDEVKARTHELEESLAQQTATADVLKVIGRSAFDLETVLGTLIDSARSLCGADFGAILLREGDYFYAYATSGIDPAFLAALKARPQHIDDKSLTPRVGRTGQIEHIPDRWSDPDYEAPEGTQTVAQPRTLLGVPLLRDGRVEGTFVLMRTERRPFAQREIDLAQTFADQAMIAIGNVRLFNEVKARTRDLEESLNQQTATADVLKVISRSAFDLQSVLDTLAESANRLCGAAYALIYLRSGDAFECRATGGAGVDDGDRLFRGRPMRAGRGTAAERVILTGEIQSIPDLLADPEFDPQVRAAILNAAGSSPAFASLRSLTAVPMKRDDIVVGVIVVARAQTGALAVRQIEVLQTFADQAVIAIENARLFGELQARTHDLEESLAQQTATAEVLKVISRSAFDLQAVLDTLVASAGELCGADGGIIWLKRGDKLHAGAAFGYASEMTAFFRANPRGIEDKSLAPRVMRSGRTEHIPDVSRDVEFSFPGAAMPASMLGVPLFLNGAIEGVFTLSRKRASAFTPRQIELVETFADQAVIAIQNARLFDEVQARTKDLSEALQQQIATADVLKIISRSAFDLQTVFDTLVKTAVDLNGAFSGAICVRDGDVYSYRASGGPGASPALHEYLRTHPAVPGRASIVGRCLLSGKIEQIPDVRADAEYSIPLNSGGNDSRALLGVPLLGKERVEGALVLTRRETGEYPARQIEILQTFADQAVIALENVRLIDEVRARTRELEQSLHDLRKAQDRLVQSEKLASLGQLTAGIAHEIKNPLNFVNNFASLSRELLAELKSILASAALEDADRGEVDELMGMLDSNFDKVAHHGKRADSIVKNMLLHSRSGSGEAEDVNVNAMVEEALSLGYHGARAEKPGFNVAIEKTLDRAAGSAQLYLQEITRVLLNLISNGFYAMAKRKQSEGPGYEPTLIASTRDLGDRIEIRIRDNGTGIPEEVRAKMFDPFYTTKPAGEGTGLGLSLSHDIVVKQHGGAIEVTTAPGQFTEFVIVLPRRLAAKGTAA